MSNKNERDELMHSNGTTPYETISIIVPSFFIVFILTLLSRNVGNINVRLLLEFVLIVIPLILIMTICAQHATTILVSLILASISISFLLLKTKGHLEHKPVTYSKVGYTSKSRVRYLTAARSTINVLSVIAILAVDFRIFPRTFTKTVSYGYSVMDTGVGLYVCSNGLLAPELRGYTNTLSRNLKNVLPLIIIGGARAILVKEIDYHVPVIEYGVHWNFFITLAAVKIISSLIFKFVSVDSSFFSAVSLLLAHEIILQHDIGKYILSEAPRNNFFSANREGIVSSLGYTALYFLSVALGNFIRTSDSKPVKLNIKFLFKLVTLTVFLLWASLILEKNFGISRRLTNSAYCIWILFIAVLMLSLFYLGEMIYDLVYNNEDSCKVPLLYEAINYNGLVFFLVANVSTGLINIMFDTLQFGTFSALIIVIIYMLSNCSVAYFLYAKQIKLKL